MTALEVALTPAGGGPLSGTEVKDAPGHIRGSSLMLAGRTLSMSITFVTQMLTVRYLSKEDFGAFAYALSMVALVQSVLALGLDRSDTRFLCLYDEQCDARRFRGVLVTELACILSLGALAVITVVLGRDLIDPNATSGAVPLLVVLIVLAPLQALDGLVLNVFASLAQARAVFFRRYLLDPLLRLLVVTAVVLAAGDVHEIAGGYVLGALIGVGFYGCLLVRLLRRSPLLAGSRGVTLGARELLVFSIPLLSGNVAYVMTTTFGALLLGHLRDDSAVAAFRAVQPVAALNTMVMLSFAVLFTPAASRLHARADDRALRELYGVTTAWLAVLTWPVFLVTTLLAEPLTTTLFGQRYAGSGRLLAILAVGYYFSASLGCNGLLLQVLGDVRWVVAGNVLTLVCAVAGGIVLVSAYGATGAALSAAGALVVRNVFNQVGLQRHAQTAGFERRYLRVYGVLAAAAAAVTLAQHLVRPPLPVAVAVVLLAAVAVARLVRGELRIAETFPEVGRLPVVGRLFAA